MMPDPPKPLPPRPTDEPPYVYPWFEPSAALEEAYQKREKLRNLLDEVRFVPSKRRQLADLESQMNPLEREIAERESSEQQAHRKALREYHEASDEYYRQNRHWEQRWRENERQAQKWQERVAARKRIAERIRRDIRRKLGADEVATKHLRWRLLPPGELSEDRIRGYYSGLQNKNPGTRYDADRIVKALSLGPDQRYEEIGEVEGYTVFTFPYTSSVLLECPIVGNAIYVIHKDWERWSKMTKQDLMADESGEVVRIVHRPGWFEKVKRELRVESPSTT